MQERKDNLKELKKYAESLRIVAENKVEAIFPNKNHQHAVIVLSTIMDFTKERFILFDDNLEGDVVNHNEVVSFKESFEKMLKRGVETTLVISDKEKDDNPQLVNFFKEKVDEYPKLFSMKLANSGFKSKMHEIYNEKINFAIGDNNKFRLELFGDNPVKEKKRIAYISFNDKGYPQELLSAFEKAYPMCTEYFNQDVN